MEDNESYLITFGWVIVGSLLVYVLKKCLEEWRKIKMAYKFNGPEDMSFLFGHMNLFILPSDQTKKELRVIARKFYPHYRVRILHRVAVFILAPEDCEIIMGTKKNSSKSGIYMVLRNWLQDGLLLSTGNKWTQRRKILTPAFHFNILKDFLAIFSEETDKVLEKLSKSCSEVIDIVPIISEFALITINETAMGTKLDPKDEQQKAYLDAVHDIEDVVRHRGNRPWLFPNWIYMFTSAYRKEKRILKVLHDFTKSVITKRMEDYKKSPEEQIEDNNDDDIFMGNRKKRLAMLDILLQANRDGEQINYEGICEEVDTFMFEGHDTTATALSFCLMLLANHSEIQDKVYEEIKSVFGEDTGKPSYQDLQKMDYLERCIKESLRLYPSVHFISRLVDEDTVLTSGFVIPKGLDVHIPIVEIHGNPEVYPNPEKFDPDRFSPENSRNRHPYAYIPFSAGPRNCIGQRFAMLEMKTLLIGILDRFKILPVDTPDTIVLKADLILKTRDGIKIKFIPRR